MADSSLPELPAQPVQAEDPERVRTARRAYSRSYLNLTLYAIIGVILTNLTALILKHTVDVKNLSDNWNYIVQFAPMYLLAFPIYLLLSRGMETAKPEEHRMHIGHLILAYFCCETIAVSGNYVGMIVNAVLSALIGVKTSSSFLEEGVFGESSLLFSCIAVIFAPFVEEMLFRKVLIDRIRKYGDKAAILLSGLLFGLFHGNFTQFFYACALGMFFAFLYVRTGRIRYTVILHMTMNFIGTVIPQLLAKQLNRLNSLMDALQKNDTGALIEMMREMLPLLIYVGCIWAVVITGLILLIVFRKRFQVAPPIAPLPKGKRFTTACVNLGFFVFLLLCMAEFIIQIMENIPSASG